MTYNVFSGTLNHAQSIQLAKVTLVYMLFIQQKGSSTVKKADMTQTISYAMIHIMHNTP